MTVLPGDSPPSDAVRPSFARLITERRVGAAPCGRSLPVATSI